MNTNYIDIYFPDGLIESIKKELINNKDIDEQWLALFLWYFYQRFLWANRKKKKNKRKKRTSKPKSIALSSVILYKIKKDYAKYIKFLSDNEVICMTSNFFRQGHMARRYILNKKYKITGQQEIYSLNKKTVINSFMRNRFKNANLPKHFKYIKEFEKIDLDIKNIKRWSYEKFLKNKQDYGSYYAFNFQFQFIMNRQFRIFEDENKRMHTSFSNLPEYVRKNFLSCKNQNFVEFDIPCCQPTLLWLIIKDSLGPESKKFKMALENDAYLFLSSLYEKKYGIQTSRKSMKGLTFPYLFGRIHENCKIRNIFKEHFPVFAEKLDELKNQHGHKHISSLLQKKESEIMNQITSELFARNIGPFFTIHDCVSVVKPFAEETETIFLDKLHSNGYNWVYSLTG